VKILVVDDNRGLAHILKMMLGDKGYQIRFARDVKDGYLTYLLFTPDVVIEDIQVIGKKGLQLMEMIRTYDPEVKTIYTCGDLAYSGAVLEEEKRKYHVGILQKPFSKGELERLLSQYLNSDIPRLNRDNWCC
jgi:DNA-binding NtrC family response regulator